MYYQVDLSRVSLTIKYLNCDVITGNIMLTCMLSNAGRLWVLPMGRGCLSDAE